MNSKKFVLVLVVALFAACGGEETAGEADAGDSSTTTQAPTTTASPDTTAAPTTTTTTTASGDVSADGEGTEFCEALDDDMTASEDVDVFDLEAFEERSRESLATIEDLADEVPNELEDSFETLLEANRDWIELLEEYDWNVLAIPEDEPRMVAMGSQEMLTAAETIIEYCGLDLLGSEPTDSGSAAGGGDLEELMPPDAGDVLTSAPLLTVESSASYDELVDHYTELLGRSPVNESDEDGVRSATYVASFEGRQVAVFIEETADGIVVSVSGG